MTSPYRVLRVIARMNVGGPALQVTGLMLELDPNRFEQRLLVGECGPEETDYLALHNLDLGETRVPGLGRAVRPLDDARALRTLVHEIRAFRPDLVHTHTAKAGLLGRVAVRLSRAAAAARDGAHLSWSPAQRLLRADDDARGRCRGTGARAPHRSTGRRGKTSARPASRSPHRSSRPVRRGPPGIALAPPPSKADARAQLGVPAEAPVVAFVGRLTRVKRPDRLVATAERVVARVPGTVFVVAGDGDLLETTRDAARALGDAVRFLGIRSDVETVLAAADVVLLTSDNEGMPVSLIEAAMAARPSVTTAVGSAGEVVIDGETGLVVERDADRLADATVRLLEDPVLRDRMGAAARAHATQGFSRARLVAATADLYDDVLGRRP